MFGLAKLEKGLGDDSLFKAYTFRQGRREISFRFFFPIRSQFIIFVVVRLFAHKLVEKS